MTAAPGGLKRPVRAVLFDLDGTLVDTAPDMVAALWRLQDERDDARVDYGPARDNVSNGALGLLRVAYPDADDILRKELLQRFLRLYQRAVAVDSRLFPGLEALLDWLDAAGLPWGVVTNKPQAFTDPLLAGLGLTRRLRAAISGDTLPQRKPDPAPMLLASRQLGIAPENTVYVGDAGRDIMAGRAAGMPTIAARWGYITADDDPLAWGADAVAETPQDLHALLAKKVG